MPSPLSEPFGAALGSVACTARMVAVRITKVDPFGRRLTASPCPSVVQPALGPTEDRFLWSAPTGPHRTAPRSVFGARSSATVRLPRGKADGGDGQSTVGHPAAVEGTRRHGTRRVRKVPATGSIRTLTSSEESHARVSGTQVLNARSLALNSNRPQRTSGRQRARSSRCSRSSGRTTAPSTPGGNGACGSASMPKAARSVLRATAATR
jgi:hypothetical protein